jgi:hypothetical protein
MGKSIRILDSWGREKLPERLVVSVTLYFLFSSLSPFFFLEFFSNFPNLILKFPNILRLDLSVDIPNVVYGLDRVWAGERKNRINEGWLKTFRLWL